MKYIKSYKVFELVIQPDIDIDEILDIVLNSDIATTNQQLSKENIEFISYDDYMELIPEEYRKTLPPKRMQVPGIYFPTFNTDYNKTYVVIEPTIFNRSKRDRMVIDFLKKTIRHENVHNQQVFRSAGYGEHIDPKSPKEYLSNKREVMAWARTALDELNDRLSPQEIFNKMNNLKELVRYSFSLGQYFQNFNKDEDIRKRFQKYFYQYFMNDFPEFESKDKLTN